MKKSKWITMAAVAMLTATVAFAAPHEGRHGKGGKFGGKRGHFGAFGPRLAEKLNLTDAQKEQIKSIRSNFREQNKAFLEQSRDTFRDFRNARKANDTARIDALRPQVEAQREQLRSLHQQLQQQLLAVLTPEQRAQYDALKAEREQRRNERRNRQ